MVSEHSPHFRNALGMGRDSDFFFLFASILNVSTIKFPSYNGRKGRLRIPANVFIGKTHKVGQLSTIDFEDESQEVFGVNKIEDFNQKQLLDLYSCVECGRCTNMCPTTGTGKKMLSPMDLIVKLRDHLTEKGAAVTSLSPWLPAYAFSHTEGNY